MATESPVIRTEPLGTQAFTLWDELVADSINGTFLHTRQFYSYHGDRFADKSLLIYEHNDVVGVFPAAEDPHDPAQISSHPGCTYGGIVHAGRLAGSRMIEAFEAISHHYAANGYARLRYKVLPQIYHRVPTQDDLYALFRSGATRYRCDISACVDLACRGKMTKGRKSALAKARKSGIRITEDTRDVAVFWEILNANLGSRHGTTAVHTLSEILLLKDIFPDNISFIIALDGEEVLAGGTIFWQGNVAHTQYLAASSTGHARSALDLVIVHGIELAYSRGCRFFEFGSSNENDGAYLNQGLYSYKRSFGAGSIVYDAYELQLREK